MKLKVQHLMDATLVLSAIIREHRSMPQKGKYRLARMHMKLLPEFNTINAQRDQMIKEYGTPEIKHDPETGDVVNTANWMVPPDKMDEFTAAWRVIGEEEVEVDVQPIALADLDCGGNGEIEAHELIILGELVAE